MLQTLYFTGFCLLFGKNKDLSLKGWVPSRYCGMRPRPYQPFHRVHRADWGGHKRLEELMLQSEPIEAFYSLVYIDFDKSPCVGSKASACRTKNCTLT